MIKKLNIVLGIGILTASSFLVESCSPEYVNPATASAEQLASNKEGLINLCVGIQRRYSFGRQSPVYSTITGSGFSTFELRILNTGNTDEANLATGKASVDGSNAVVGQLWNQSFLTIKECNLVLSSLDKVADAGTRSGIQGYGAIFKALSLGNLATFFEKSPKNIAAVGGTASFVDRKEVLQEAISILETAAKQVESAAVSAEFKGKVPAGIDVQNTIYALLARYNNMLGNNDNALAWVAKVDLTKKSYFNYDAVSPNPIAFVAITNVNVYQPRTMQFGLPTALVPETGDARVAFYLRNASSTATADPRGNAPFFNANTSQLPIYLPGEMTLIKAEALARKNQLVDAVTEINKIRKKTAAQDAWGVGAALTTDFAATTQADVLQEIYRQRCIELFMSGLKLEDARRFSRNMPVKDAVDANDETNRVFYPYPFSERDNNTGTPTDPTI